MKATDESLGEGQAHLGPLLRLLEGFAVISHIYDVIFHSGDLSRLVGNYSMRLFKGETTAIDDGRRAGSPHTGAGTQHFISFERQDNGIHQDACHLDLLQVVGDGRE